MSWSQTSSPRLAAVALGEGPSGPSGSVLATAQGEVLEALGIGVVACDASLRILAASSTARAVLARLAPDAATDQLPASIATPLRVHARSPVRISMGVQTVSVWARPVELGWVSLVVWLSVDAGPDDLDATMRRLWRLSRRQLDLVHQLRQGYRNQEIAAHLGLTCSTVKSYLSHLFDALGVRSRGEAIALIERTRRGE